MSEGEALPRVNNDFVVSCNADYETVFLHGGRQEEVEDARLRWVLVASPLPVCSYSDSRCKAVSFSASCTDLMGHG